MARPFCSGVSMSSQVSDMMRLIEYSIPNYKDFSFLDLGCGKGMYGYILRCIYGFSRTVTIDGVDIKLERQFQPYLRLLYNRLWEEPLEENLFLRKPMPYTITFAQQVMEHLPEETALKCLTRITETSHVSIVGFPSPKEHYEKKDNRNAHLWGCSDEKLFNIGYKRVDAIENNHVYIWMNTWRGEKHWKLRGGTK